MKYLFLVALQLILYCTAFGQNEQKSTNLYVAFEPFKWDQELSIEQNLSNKYQGFQRIQEIFGFNLVSAIPFDNQQYIKMSKAAVAQAGNDSSITKLKFIFQVKLNDFDQKKLHQIANELKKISGVRYCNIMSDQPIKPPFDIMPVTDDYLPLQEYIFENPGVEMNYAWDLGYNGQGVNLRDVEYGFNKNHEDLNEMNVFLAPGMTVHHFMEPESTEHGTATFGVLFAHHGDYGVSGMAHGANEAILFPEYTEENNYNRVFAVSKSIEASEPGDIILFEMQTWGIGAVPPDIPYYVPAEYDETIWDLTKAATDAGIIIVAAAGNGGVNLDAPEYLSYRNRGNSGAIIVGAGAPDLTHKKLYFSTYGSRVDLQGWGSNVLSSGYGSFASIGGDFNQNYVMFSGTSSATPIVASCVAVLQSYHLEKAGYKFNAAFVKDILQQTGIAQGSPATGNIGPLPNMRAAIQLLDTVLSVKMKEEVENLMEVDIYPIPFENELHIEFKNNKLPVNIYLYNSSGQLVLQKVVSNSILLNTETLASGLYFVHFKNDNNQTVRKIVKL